MIFSQVLSIFRTHGDRVGSVEGSALKKFLLSFKNGLQGPNLPQAYSLDVCQKFVSIED